MRRYNRCWACLEISSRTRNRVPRKERFILLTRANPCIQRVLCFPSGWYGRVDRIRYVFRTPTFDIDIDLQNLCYLTRALRKNGCKKNFISVCSIKKRNLTILRVCYLFVPRCRNRKNKYPDYSILKHRRRIDHRRRSITSVHRAECSFDVQFLDTAETHKTTAALFTRV